MIWLKVPDHKGLLLWVYTLSIMLFVLSIENTDRGEVFGIVEVSMLKDNIKGIIKGIILRLYNINYRI